MRLFADEQPSLHPLIAETQEASISGRFRTSVLAAFTTPSPPPEASASSRKGQNLAEPLSKRELEVLQLIYEGLPNKDIATGLNLAPATVKAHIRNLYGKIGATSRTEALALARKLGLLDDAH